MRYVTIFSMFGLLACVSAQMDKPDWRPQFLGKTELRHAAFVELFRSEDTSQPYEDQWTLFATTFDALAVGRNDLVFYMKSPGRYLHDISNWDNLYLKNYDNSTVWPNNPGYMPSSVVGVEGIVQPSGFLVTTKKDGQLQLYDTSMDPPGPAGGVNIAENDSNEWSYHRVIWYDMDQDGDLDAVTARFHVNNLGNVKNEFVWLENEDIGMVPEWPTHVVSDSGPDIAFANVTLTAGGRAYDCFIFAEFFQQRMSIYWTENEMNDWSNASEIMSRVVDPNADQPFDVLVDDFNRDGSMELMVPAFNTLTLEGYVKVYFFPDDFRTDEWTSVVIADNFLPNEVTGGSAMSPGTPKTYYPSKAYADDTASDGMPHKPFVGISGDDDGRMYVLWPVSDNRTDWTYEKHIIMDLEADTCGSFSTADLDNDGYEELIIAGYSTSDLNVYSYKP